MMKNRQFVRLGAVLILLGAGAASLAANPEPVAAGAASEPRPLAPGTPLGSGPFESTIVQDPGLPDHTIYRPSDLSALGSRKLPIVAWGNGACADNGTAFRWFLSEIASYGFLVISNGPIAHDPVAFHVPASTRQRPGGGSSLDKLPPAPTHTQELLDAVDWAVAQNRLAGSPLHGHLATDEIAIMGQSCGGVQTIEAAADPRVKTAMVWNSGLWPQPNQMAGGKTMTKTDLAALHSPVAYITGDAEDVAYVNANDDFRRLSARGLPVFRGYERGVSHGGTYADTNGGEFGGVAVAWLQWQLQHNEKAGRMFRGKACGLCVNPRWVAAENNLD